MPKDFTGISFPFRIGVKGGVVMSSVDEQDAQHISESIEQILGTRSLERCMEFQIKSEISVHLFEPNDVSTRTLVAYEAKKAIEECDDRVEVVSVTPYSNDGELYVIVTYRVKKYDKTYTVNVKVGG